jgi:hypothetical protein
MTSRHKERTCRQKADGRAVGTSAIAGSPIAQKIRETLQSSGSIEEKQAEIEKLVAQAINEVREEKKMEHKPSLLDLFEGEEKQEENAAEIEKEMDRIEERMAEIERHLDGNLSRDQREELTAERDTLAEDYKKLKLAREIDQIGQGKTVAVQQRTPKPKRISMLLTLDEVDTWTSKERAEAIAEWEKSRDWAATHAALAYPEWFNEIETPEKGLVFDHKLASFFFAATRTWKECEHVTLDDLRDNMPDGVINPKAERAATWDPILRSLDRETVKTTIIGDKIISITSGEDANHLTVIDMKNKTFSCSCQAFNKGYEAPRTLSENVNYAKRHVLCKHLLLTITHHHGEFLKQTDAGNHKEIKNWEESFEKCSAKPSVSNPYTAGRRKELLSNWVYYFIRHKFASLNYSSALFPDAEHIENSTIPKILNS